MASASANQCQCSAGYEASGGNLNTYGGFPCSPCAPGFFKAAAGPQPCEPCESGSYKNASGAGNCTRCAGSLNFSPAGSVGPQNCSCDCGFEELAAQNCTACLAGTYKDVTGAGPCTPCPFPDSTSPPQAALNASCACNAGFAGGPGTACVRCAGGSAKLVWGHGECEACADGTLPADAAWVEPTSVASPCAWECLAGLYHPDSLSGGGVVAEAAAPNACKQCELRPAENP
eukprot:907696-Rhodomonas_salina.1